MRPPAKTVGAQVEGEPAEAGWKIRSQAAFLHRAVSALKSMLL
jgi:hypothetical protein